MRVSWSWIQTPLESIKSVFFLKLYQLWGVGENRYAWVPLGYPLSYQARSLESLYVSFPAVSHVKDLGSVTSHFTAICGPLAEKGQWGCRNGELAVLTCFRLSRPAVGGTQVAPVSLHPGILQGLPSWRGDVRAGEDQGVVAFLRMGSVWILEECLCVLYAEGKINDSCHCRCIFRECLQCITLLLDDGNYEPAPLSQQLHF